MSERVTVRRRVERVELIDDDILRVELDSGVAIVGGNPDEVLTPGTSVLHHRAPDGVEFLELPGGGVILHRRVREPTPEPADRPALATDAVSVRATPTPSAPPAPLSRTSRGMGPVVVPGMGPDAPTIVHEDGSRQSACPYALDVIPHAQSLPSLLGELPSGDSARREIGLYLTEGHAAILDDAWLNVLDSIATRMGTSDDPALALLEVGRVLANGERKYGSDTNWRAIPVRMHLRHALAHLVADAAGDRSEGELGHLAHAGCRVAFCLEILAKPRPVFDEGSNSGAP